MNPSPETTARDVRNAYMTLAHLGHTRCGLINDKTGAVCLDGAIRLATSEKLLYYGTDQHGKPLPAGFFDRCHLDDNGSLRRRRQAVQRAVAEFLPPDPCYSFGGGPKVPLDPEDKIVHYNDAHCQGDAEAAELLRVTAEKLEAEL